MGVFPKQPMILTDDLMRRDISLSLKEEPTNSEYKMFNTGGVEVEVGEFLYGLVRMLKPNNVFETGTHLGISSSYIARALKDNKKGLLTTVEISKEFINASEQRWRSLNLDSHVVCDKSKSLEYQLVYDCELMFLDSEPEFRFKELVKFWDKLVPGGLAIIHDLHRHLGQEPNFDHGFGWPFGELHPIIKKMLGEDKLRVMSFPTPRGISMFYKVHPKDYKWNK